MRNGSSPLRQHLETGQGFLKRTIGPDQTQAVNNIALRAVVLTGAAARTWMDHVETVSQSSCTSFLGVIGKPRGRQRYQSAKRLTSREILR